MDYLPVAVCKGSKQVQGLSGDHCQLRQLCPRGQLLAFLEEGGVLRVRDLAEASMRGVVKSQRFSRCVCLYGLSARRCVVSVVNSKGDYNVQLIQQAAHILSNKLTK